MRAHSKTVIAALVERRSARHERLVRGRDTAGQNVQTSSVDGLYNSGAAHLLVHSRF